LNHSVTKSVPSNHERSPTRLAYPGKPYVGTNQLPGTYDPAQKTTKKCCSQGAVDAVVVLQADIPESTEIELQPTNEVPSSYQDLFSHVRTSLVLLSWFIY
jgi:hypothetical protein